MKVCIGIDPGASGCVAVIEAGVITTCSLKETDRDVALFLAHWRDYAVTNGHELAVILEHVHARPGNGNIASFKLGCSFGTLYGMLTALAIPFHLVRPTVWQRKFSLLKPRGKVITQTQKKNMHKKEAQRRYPEVKVIHLNADAILIAEYARVTEAL